MALICGTMAILSAVSTSCLVSSLTSTTKSICYSLVQLTSYDQPGMDEVLKKIQKTDINHTMTIIKEIIDIFVEDSFVDMDMTTEITEKKYKKKLPNHVKKAIYGIDIILDEIQRELVKIDEAVKNHRSKWFGKYRVFTCDCNINNICDNVGILKSRYRLLIDAINIPDKI